MLSTFRESIRTAQNNGDRICATYRGREANEGLRVGLRIRRIPASRRLNNLFSRTEEIIIHRPLDVALDAEAKTSLERTIDRNNSLPGVSGTHMLNGGDYGPPGSRRLTCLTDGSTLVEEVWKMCGTRTQRNSATSFGITPAKKAVRWCTE